MAFESENPLHLPILDVSKQFDSSYLPSLAEACKEWGFFQIINHGITKEIYAKIYSLSNEMFALPPETMLKLGPFSSLKSYTPRFIASPFFESIRVSGPDFDASVKSSLDVLGKHDKEFSEVLQEYGSKMIELSKTILKILLMILGDGFETKYYEPEFKNCHGYLRINNYTPPKNIRDQVEEEVEGLGMHTDMSCLTIVYQDEIGGLQVRSREGKWMDIAPCEGTLVVNIGDMLQAWSNERLRSSEHRVVLKKPTNRLSLAFFWCFEDDKVIHSPDDVVGRDNVKVYRPFVCSEYLRFRESNEKGRFEKVGFTVRDFAGV
ncbi:2-oxoglutarate (2OG) and Fe(II)-dependent oxygenase superfamily protein [Striga hermonthica]|uniref:2-oxoglutarate (2OG) and Fe(II)-dependent oxygenase superfamily protein n=1 Tax=Striga hermonthica TaxID=68872 RepID=A0A9N7N288_STRHE|nr:2-oxoglutarate (2OG) and Fe(II)-dependent oxygenase superfamily protein [Striga hermonthica]